MGKATSSIWTLENRSRIKRNRTNKNSALIYLSPHTIFCILKKISFIDISQIHLGTTFRINGPAGLARTRIHIDFQIAIENNRDLKKGQYSIVETPVI